VTSLYEMRDRIRIAVAKALRPSPDVLAGWEGGSAAFGIVDAYSDIDLSFLVTDAASLDALYAISEEALREISPILASHNAPPGRYYKLRDAGDFLLLDLCFFRVSDSDYQLDVDRHGQAVPLFDKADWLHASGTSDPAKATARQHRYAELQGWFLVSQDFVRKELLRGRSADAMAAFWGYTLRPLAELLRMRYCPARWDFGMRYLDRDLPPSVHAQFCDLLFVRDLKDLEDRFAAAQDWGTELLNELAERVGSESSEPKNGG
jgi:hypothetical protein